ncbi:MAG TPA: helix-turn-helix domain-containing protein [Streptosporangiaceae bacterium]
MSGEPVEIVIRLQLELPPGMSLMAAPAADEPRAYRTAAAAELLGISKSKVCELIAQGAIESKKDGNMRLIPDHAIRAYLASQAGDGDAKAG